MCMHTYSLNMLSILLAICNLYTCIFFSIYECTCMHETGNFNNLSFMIAAEITSSSC